LEIYNVALATLLEVIEHLVPEDVTVRMTKCPVAKDLSVTLSGPNLNYTFSIYEHTTTDELADKVKYALRQY